MNYVVLGTNNMNAAIDFYDSLFEGTEINKVIPTERMTYWIGEDFAFAIAIPFDEKPASNGNGTMIGFNVGNTDDVKRFYNRAVELGGTSEGEPNQRGPRFSAYVRDLDKNKLCFSD
jgi:predicted lactoylglutathione lyase